MNRTGHFSAAFAMNHPDLPASLSPALRQVGRHQPPEFFRPERMQVQFIRHGKFNRAGR